MLIFYCFGKRFVKVLTPYWYTAQCVRTQRSHAAELLLGRFRKNEALLWHHTTLLISGYNSTYVQGRRKSITLRTPHFFWTCPIELHQIRFLHMFVYCRKPSSCMIVGSNKSYHSMRQSIILHENFDKPFAIAIHSAWRMKQTDIHTHNVKLITLSADMGCKSRQHPTGWKDCALLSSSLPCSKYSDWRRQLPLTS